MRILVIHNYYREWGGADATVRFDAALLRSAGHEVVEYSRNSEELEGGIERWTAALSSFHSMRTVRDVDRLCRQRFDIAHVHNIMPLITPAVYGALARHGVPIVQTVNDYRMMCVNGLFYTQGAVCTRCQHGNFLHSIPRGCHPKGPGATALYAAVLGYARMARIFMRHVRIFIAVSDFVRRRLRRIGIPFQRVVVKGNIPDNVGEPSFEPGGYGLYLGRLSREKGVWTLLQALERFRGIPFKIAGTGPEESSLRACARERALSHVEFLGFVPGDARWNLLRRAAFLVCPSECYETFGISVAESLSLGTPVIVSRSGGLPELVAPEATGAVFEPGDPVQLAGAMERLHRDGSRMRAASRSFYEERLAKQRAVDALEEAYARALCDGAPPDERTEASAPAHIQKGSAI